MATRPSRFPLRDARPLAGAPPMRSPPPNPQRPLAAPPAPAPAPSVAAPAPRPKKPLGVSALDGMDEDLERRVLAPCGGGLSPSGSGVLRPAAGGAAPSAGAQAQHAAVASLSARLTQMERLLRNQEAVLRKRDEELVARDDEIARLRRTNRQMQRFLADYGLEWVGDKDGSSGEPSRAGSRGGSGKSGGGGGRRAGGADEGGRSTTPAKSGKSGGKSPGSGPPTPRCAAPDMERVRAAVAELNELASSSGASEVARRADGSHGFAGAAALHLTFWRDGLQVGELPVRAWSDASARAFMRDLLDGYFPYELKHAYPEGVHFLLRDRLAEASAAPAHSWGEGRALDSRAGRRTERGPSPSVHNSSSAEPAGGGAHVHALTFADGVGGMGGADAAPVAAPVVGEGGDACRLQIKDGRGAVAAVLTFAADATVADVQAALVTRGVGEAGGFELRTAFPARSLRDDLALTLAEAGLAPSATLCVRPLPVAGR